MNNLIVHVRWLVRTDMPLVLAIERESFSPAWDEDDFLAVLRQRHCLGLAADREGMMVAGFMIYEFRKASIDILNLGVSPLQRGRGVGWQLVEHMKNKASMRRRPRLSVTVRESNLAAQVFFRRQGFRAVKVLRGFYGLDTGEDAYRMCWTLPDLAASVAAAQVRIAE